MFRSFVKLLLAFLLLALPAAPTARGEGTINVGGFVEDVFYTGNGMISMRFDYAGRLWVNEKQGRILVFTPNGTGGFNTPPTVFADFTSQVDDTAERGMMGLAIDPDFANNHYLYIQFATASDARILRLTANVNFTAMVPGSELILISGLPNTATIHKSGDLQFHPNDPHNLYVTIGDDGNAGLVANLDVWNGKILKISASDGTGLTTNPYYDGNVNSIRSRVWSARYRNAFRFAFDPAVPVDDVLYISENGDGSDRIARIAKGADGGWNNQFEQSSADGKRRIMDVSNPSKTGLVIVRSGPLAVGGQPTVYNARQQNGFTDVKRWLLTTAPSSTTPFDQLTPIVGDPSSFWSNSGNIASFTMGPDGWIYFTGSGQGPDISNAERLGRIKFVGGTNPVANFTSVPASGQSPLQVTFTDSSTAPGSTLASWAWTFGDGTTSTAASPVKTYAQPGVYTVTLTVTNAQGLANAKTSTITVYNQSSITLTGQIYDGRSLASTNLATATDLRFYQADGTTPVAVTGGTGPNGNSLTIPGGGTINVNFSAQLTGAGLVVSASESTADGLEAAFVGIPLSTTALAQSATANFYLSDTMLRGRAVDTKGVAAATDIGVSRGAAGAYYGVAGGRDFLGGSGNTPSGVNHRVVADALGYYHAPIITGGGNATFYLDTGADTLTSSHGKVTTSVAVSGGATTVKNVTIGLYNGGTNEADLSGIAVTPNVSFAQLQAIFNTSCTGCHSATATNVFGLNLENGFAYSNLVDKASGGAPGVKLVQSGSAARSYLMEKLNAAVPQTGTSMRPGDPMPLAQRALFRDWINQLTPPNPNAPPEIDSALSQTGIVAAPLVYQITAINTATSFTAAPLPPGLTLNPTTGVISGAPTAAGTTNTIITATNGNGTDTETLVFTITAGPPPSITSALAVSAPAGVAFTYTITAANNPASFTAAPLPAGLSINTSTGVISGTVSTAGTNNITITATNANGTDTETLALSFVSNLSVGRPTVTSLNPLSPGSNAVDTDFINSRWESKQKSDPEWIYIDLGVAKSVRKVVLKWENAAGKDYKLQITNDPNGTWTEMVNVLGNSTTGEIVYDGLNYVGRYVRMYGTARTTDYGYSLYNFEVWGFDAPQSPLINSPLTANGSLITVFNYQIAATNNPTSFNATGLPGGLSINTSTGVISGTPAATGTSNIAISATNNLGTDTKTLVLTVTSGPVPSITSSLTAAGLTNTAFSYQITATNSPGSFNATGLPTGLSINPSTGVISGTPTVVATSNVTITATNVHGTDTKTLVLSITSNLVNLSVGKTAVSSPFPVQPASNAVDLDFNNTRWESQHNNNNGWMYIDLGAVKLVKKVVLKWENAAGKDYILQITNDPNGTWTDMVNVSNNATTGVNINYDNLNFTGRYVRMLGILRTTIYGYSLYNFEVWGSDVPPAPSITSSLAASGTVGLPFNYQIVAANSPTSYNATGLPSGLSINTSTGAITGTPGTAATTNVTITATNAGGTDTETLVLTVGSPSTLAFSASSYSAQESSANINTTISVARNGSSAGAVGVTVSVVAGGTATGADYTFTSTTLSWADGDNANKTFTIPILADNVAEGNETVNLALSVPTGGAALGTPNTATLTIVDRPFDAWRLQVFGPDANTPEAQPLADYDRDGVNNFLEHYLSGNPTVAESGALTDVDPAANGRMQISFTRNINATGAIISVEATNSLTAGPWVTIASKTGAAAWVSEPGVDVSDSPTTGAVTVTDAVTNAGNPPRYLRVRVERTTD